MNRSIRSLAASMAVTLCLWPAAAAAQDASPSAIPTVEQVRGVFSSAGYQADPPLIFNWTSPPVSSFRVHDPARGRELMVLVYPSASAAQTAIEREPRLVIGYGEGVRRGNVALVQSTQAELDRAFQLQIDRDNGVYVAPEVVPEPGSPRIAVDLDFLQALDDSAANL